jgi:hypothetical protein
VPGVHAVFAANSDLSNFSGFKQGDPDYERAINMVHDAAIKAGKKLCGPFAWKDRPDFTCFQAGGETAAIARGARAELGDLANTQGKPEVGRSRRRSRSRNPLPPFPADFARDDFVGNHAHLRHFGHRVT